MIESVVIGDDQEITALFSRQSGKGVANVVASLMVLLPRLAPSYREMLAPEVAHLRDDAQYREPTPGRQRSRSWTRRSPSSSRRSGAPSSRQPVEGMSYGIAGQSPGRADARTTLTRSGRLTVLQQ